MPPQPPHPADNAPTPERVALGKMLFFDPRLSGDGNMSCASCHAPMLGWSDGLPVARGFRGKQLPRASPTIISRDSPFDHWVAGDKNAMTGQQLRGMAIFMDKDKGNCAACHSAPNFTDNGFHNIGLASFGKEHPDMGRYKQKPIAILKGAFKTPTLRDIEQTAPYFHDGSAMTLMDMVNHYARGGDVRTNLDPNMKPLNLTRADKEDLVAFLRALSSPPMKVELPSLPHD